MATIRAFRPLFQKKEKAPLYPGEWYEKRLQGKGALNIDD